MIEVRTPQRRERAGGWVVLLMLLGLTALAAALYAGAYAAAGDKVPRGTSIAGVEVGGKSKDEAVAAVRRDWSARADDPIAVSVGGREFPVVPDDAGLRIDAEASVDAVGAKKSWSPRWLWNYFTGGEEQDPVVVVQESRLSGVLDQIDSATSTAPRDGQVRLTRTGVKVRDPRTGQALDREAARAALVAAVESGDDSISLELVTTEPEIDAADVQAAVDGFANPALSAPVTLRFGDSPVRLSPRRFAPVLSLRPVDGTLQPQVDEAKLAALVDSAVGEAGAPVDAAVRLVNGRPKVIPAKPGVSYEQADVTASFLELVVAPEGEREVEVPATVAEPDFTTAEARALKIKEKVSTFTTYFPYAEYRNVNIGRAGELINGTVLLPGETFSLNDTVGERTRENGFTEGFIISNGIFKEDLGGGVSQMATTTFNAAFFAGLKDIEHKPHSFYIDRYPEGREATVAWGSVDLRFENDSPYGILIEATVTPGTPSTQGVVTVSMWSTKVWDIAATKSDRYNFTSPATRTLDTEDCYPNTGYGGFDVDVTRIFRPVGSTDVDHTEKFHTTYIPSDTVICKPPGSLP